MLDRYPVSVEYDRTPQVLRIDVDAEKATWDQYHRSIPPEEIENEAGHRLRFEPFEERPVARLSELVGEHADFACLMAFGLDAKRTDDRILARIETLVHSRPGKFVPRSELLHQLADTLSATDSDDEARAVVDAARSLVRRRFEFANDRVRELAEVILADAGRDPVRWQPMGFWSENERLTGIYRQSRLLQQPLPTRVADSLRTVLSGESGLARIYSQHIGLLAKLTGSFACASLLEDAVEPGTSRAIFPAARSLEGGQDTVCDSVRLHAATFRRCDRRGHPGLFSK